MPEWPTVWAAVQGIALAAAAAIAWFQITALRKDQKAWKTLEACERYESDQVIVGALKSLRDGRDGEWKERTPRSLRLEAVLLLNYLEGIALAADQGFYVESIVRAHLEPMMRDHVKEFFDPEMVRRMELKTEDFNRLRGLLDRWSNEPLKPAL